MKEVKTKEQLPDHPHYKKLYEGLNHFRDHAPWKDTIPAIIAWIEKNQPADNPYDLQFWIEVYKSKFPNLSIKKIQP